MFFLPTYLYSVKAMLQGVPADIEDTLIVLLELCVPILMFVLFLMAFAM